MNAEEWWPVERVLPHIAKALDVSLLHAGDELMYAVEEGCIAFADRRGEPLVFEPKHWELLRATVRVQKWGKDYETLLRDVYFRRTDVEREWPLPDAVKAEPPAPEVRSRDPGGTLVQNDWDRIVGEVVRHVHEAGVPAHIEPFADRILVWCDGTLPADRVPGKSILTRRLKVWLALVRHEAEPG